MVFTGSVKYYLWLGLLLSLMLAGAYGYSIQFNEGLVSTGMHDHVSWGIYISNFIFFVGVAAGPLRYRIGPEGQTRVERQEELFHAGDQLLDLLSKIVEVNIATQEGRRPRPVRGLAVEVLTDGGTRHAKGTDGDTISLLLDQ